MSIPPRTFYFLRHGQTDWNVEGRLQGHTDIPLNATGIAQAHSAAIRLTKEPITRIISSPLVRALKTAAITAESIKLPVHIDSQLMERTFGSLEGRLTTQVKAEHGLSAEQSITLALPGDAEQWPQTLQRARSSISYWLNQYPADTLLFVGHGAFFRAMYEVLTETLHEAHNATPYLFTPTASGGWNMREV